MNCLALFIYLWDYEGKIECADRSWAESIKVLEGRLKSPPGKIIRAILFKLLGGKQTVPTKGGFKHEGLVIGKTKDIPFSPLEKTADVRMEAACADDAEIDLSTWALPNETIAQSKARACLRQVAVKWWSWSKISKVKAWLNKYGRCAKDHAGVADCIARIKACQYFKWTRGSRIFFWLIPTGPEYQGWFEDFRDGVKLKILPDAVLPKGRMRNIPTETREDELLTREKIFRLRFCWYIEKGPVKLVIPRFSVPKAGSDIRVVFDSKANGHNACVWAASFLLGFFGDLMEMVCKWLSIPVGIYFERGCPDEDYTQDSNKFIKSWQGDIDVGSQFHNYRAHEDDRPYLGVRIHDTRNDGGHEHEWFMRYAVTHFGGRASPYNACQGQARILELAKGKPWEPDSEFQWDSVLMNLPTSKDWDPSMPRVILLRKDKELASQEVNYVDDIHPVARGVDDTSAVRMARQLRTKMNYYGNQADDKKYRRPTCTPGAWKGEILHTDQPFPRKSTTGKKWLKFKSGLQWVLEQSRNSGEARTGELRRIAGLGVNVTEIYDDARAYLKGFFNAVESFRADRDRNGWRIKDGVDGPVEPELGEDSGLTPAELEIAIEEARDLDVRDVGPTEAGAGYPEMTRITDKLVVHTEALLELFDSDEPLALFVRPSSSSKFRYYVGDASREGLGGGTQFPDGTIRGRRGVWDSKFASGGSNLREAQNQVNHLLGEVRVGLHDGCAVWAFTDNGCWSAVWRKGLSSAEHLFRLMLQLKIACREHEVYLSVCHISGNRMIATGVDGWSRGDFESGVSLGFDLRDYLPLERTALEVAGETLIPWLRSWMGDDYTAPLTPEGWFWKGHMPGIHLWAPPPAAGRIALRQLSRAKHKRPEQLTHVVLIPRLLYWEEWQGRFEKEMDLWFMMHAGSAWPAFAHEPLLVGLSFPMHRSYPWLLRLESQKVVEIGRSLSELSKSSHLLVGNYLRKLWSDPRALPTVSRSMVC